MRRRKSEDVLVGYLVLFCMVLALAAFLLNAVGSLLTWPFGGGDEGTNVVIGAAVVGTAAVAMLVQRRRKLIAYLRSVQEEADRQRQEAERRIRALQLSDVDAMDGIAFERYVARLLTHQGFQVTVTKSSGDMGVDVIAEKAGVRYAIQAKRYTGSVSRSAVSDAVAGKAHYQCAEAMVVTNRHFTRGARELARSTSCTLVDRHTLAAWILDFHEEYGRSGERWPPLPYRPEREPVGCDAGAVSRDTASRAPCFRLVVLAGPLHGQSFSLSDRLTLGRDRACDITTLTDTTTSRQHAIIIRTAHGFMLHDTGSTNGTFVNGRRITTQVLCPQDVIGIGANQLRFERADAD